MLGKATQVEVSCPHLHPADHCGRICQAASQRPNSRAIQRADRRFPHNGTLNQRVESAIHTLDSMLAVSRRDTRAAIPSRSQPLRACDEGLLADLGLLASALTRRHNDSAAGKRTDPCLFRCDVVGHYSGERVCRGKPELPSLTAEIRSPILLSPIPLDEGRCRQEEVAISGGHRQPSARPRHTGCLGKPVSRRAPGRATSASVPRYQSWPVPQPA